MGIAVLTFADLFAPLQALASQWLSPRRTRRTRSANLRYVAIRPACGARTADAASTHSGPAARPLRVVRVIDHKAPRDGSRVVISGRMADVCAELDRLATLEMHGASPTARNAH